MIIGRFYFRRTTSGNLIGEFSNQYSSANSTESADRIGVDTNDFTGTFLSSWCEDDESMFASLEVSRKINCKNVFSLVWRWKNGKGAFWGEGMLVENLLIGDYHDFEVKTN